MDGDKKRLSRLDEEDGGLDETRGGEKESSPESNTSRPSLEKKKSMREKILEMAKEDRENFKRKARALQKRIADTMRLSDEKNTRSEALTLEVEEEARTAAKLCEDLQEQVKKLGADHEISAEITRIRERIRNAKDPKIIRAEVCALESQIQSLAAKVGLSREKRRNILASVTKTKDILKVLLQIDDKDERKVAQVIKSIKSGASQAGVDAVLTGTEIARRLIERPGSASEVALEVKDKLDKTLYGFQAKAKNVYAEFQETDRKQFGAKAKEIVEKGRNIFYNISQRYLQTKHFRAIVKHRLESLKIRLKSALFTEIEGGIQDIYFLQSGKNSILEEVCPKKLIPALLAPFLLALSQLSNILWLLNFPIYISYVILLGLEWEQTCIISQRNNISLQGMFLLKAIFDSLYLWPSVVLYFWIRKIQSSHRANEEEDRREIETKISYEVNSNHFQDEVTPKERRKEIIEMRATRAIERLECYDEYNHSYTHHARDFWALVATLFDLIFGLAFETYEKSQCDRCDNLHLYGIMTFIAIIYTITFLIRFPMGLFIFISWIVQSPYCKSHILAAARSVDNHHGFRVLEFFLENVVFRPSLHEMKASRHRKSRKRRKELFQRRKSLIEELWKLDEELGVEEDIKIWKRTQDVLKSTKEHRKHRKKGKRNKHAVTDEHAQKGDSIGRQSVPSKRMSLSTSRDVGREEKVFNVSGVPDAVELDDIETTESKKMI